MSPEADFKEGGFAEGGFTEDGFTEDGFRPAFGIVELAALAAHEQTMPDHLAELTAEISRDGELRQPIVVDRRSLVILDGHHRAAALRALGCTLIPAWLVDYRHPAVVVLPRRPDIPVTKEAVVHTGTSGRLFPPKTTRHVLPGCRPARPTPLGLLGLGGNKP